MQVDADATVPKRSVNPNRVLKPFDPDAACDKSVYDVLVPQQFQGCITTAPPTAPVSAQKIHKERHAKGKGVKTSAFKQCKRFTRKMDRVGRAPKMTFIWLIVTDE